MRKLTGIAGMATSLVVVAFIVVLPLVACSGGSTPLTPATSSDAVFRSVIPTTTSNLLFASDEVNNKILVFDAATNVQNPAPLRTITNGIQGPIGITTDLEGNLYVANYLSNTVTVYAPGANTPKQRISNGVNGPWDVKVDGFGNIYVANQPALSGPDFIREYAAGATTPKATWLPPQGTIITGIALLNPKTTPSIYAVGYVRHKRFATETIIACRRGQSTCTQVASPVSGQTGGIDVEQSPGGNTPFEFLVANQTVDQNLSPVYVYQNSNPPVLIDQFPIQGVPELIALDSTRTHLFVANKSSHQADELTFPGGKVVNHFKSPFAGPIWGVATDPAGTYF